MAERTVGAGNQPGEIQNRQSEKGIFRLPRFQIEAPPKEREMGVEITHGRQGTEKMQRKLLEQEIPAAIVGKITEPAGTEIYVTQSRKW